MTQPHTRTTNCKSIRGNDGRSNFQFLKTYSPTELYPAQNADGGDVLTA
jgi:hypothetical protein